MIQIPEEVKQLFKQDSINKNFRVSFPNGEYRDLVNSDMVSESVVFTESLNSSDELKFGLCEGSTLEFETFFNANIKNLQIQAGIEIDVSSLYGEQSSHQEFTITAYVTEQSQGFVGEKEYTAPFTGDYLFKSYALNSIVVDNIEIPATAIIDEQHHTYYYVQINLRANQTVTLKMQGGGGSSAYVDYPVTVDVNYTGYPDYSKISDDVQFPFYSIPYGLFYVKSCKRDGNSGIRKVVAYQNNYDNKTIAGNKTQLTEFEKMKMASTTPTNTGYSFNSLFNSVCQIPSLFENMITEGIFEPTSVTEDFNVYSYINSAVTQEQFSKRTGKAYQELAQYTDFDSNSWSDILEIEYVYITFSGVHYKQSNCPGVSPYNVRASSENSFASNNISPASNSIYQISLDYEKSIRDFVEEVYDHSPLPSYEQWLFPNVPKISKETLYDMLCPHISSIGMTPDGRYPRSKAPTNERYMYQNSQYLDYSDVKDNRIFWSDENTHIKALLYPYNAGVTDYSANSYPVNRLGCVGYHLVIPLKFVIRETGLFTHNSVLYKSPDLIKIENAKIIQYQFDTSFTNAFNRVVAREKLVTSGRNLSTSANYNGTVYHATRLITDTQDTLKYKESFNAIVELQGAFAKIDRYTNELKIVNLYNMLPLYPSPNLYPISNSDDEPLYPQSYSELITRTLWKSLWYDDVVTTKYRRVTATWTANGVEQAVSYTIISDADIINPNDYSDYDLSNNYFIKNGCFSTEQVELIVEIIAKKLKNIKYYMCDIEMRGLPYLEAGDAISAITRDSGFSTFVLRHRISGIHALMESIEVR